MPTAIEIFKLLPKTNCAKCGFPTCLAFAMQLANQKVKLSDCPFISEQAKASLEASSAPPIRLVKFGIGENKVEVGEETELYRHEKKFYHLTRYALVISDKESKQGEEEKLKKLRSLRYERVGQVLKFDALGLRNESGDAHCFAAFVEEASRLTDLPLILFSEPEGMRRAGEAIKNRVPLLHAATTSNFEEMAKIAKDLKCPLAVKASNLGELADLVQKLKSLGVEDIVLDIDPKGLKDLLEKSTILRRNAVKKLHRGLGYPLMITVGGDERSVLEAMISTMKYGGVVAFENIDLAQALALMVLRQNIYTDPQVPIQVKPGLYPINNPNEKSRLMMTVNFSLTYFTVVGDVEKSKTPIWLQVVDTEGLSVMTAFAAGKVTAESVEKALQESGAKQKSNRGEIIIPGMLSRMSGKLQEVSGLRVIVGPRESSGIPKLLKSLS